MGNPGKKYIFSRHNVGFMVLDYLSRKYSSRFRKSFVYSAGIARIRVKNEDVILAKPLMFMNNSGRCVKKIVLHFGADIQKIIIAYDDVDLTLGKIRFRVSGGSAGHRGMSSVIESLATNAINRVRIGIGRPAGDGVELADYVLSFFTLHQKAVLENALERAAACCIDWVNEDPLYLMQKYN